MCRFFVAISLIIGLSVPVLSGPYKDAIENAEKAYHDCIINKHQNKPTDDCNQLHDKYLEAFDAYRNSDEYASTTLKSEPDKQQTLDSLLYRIERLERRVQDLESDLDSLRSRD